VVSSLNEPDRNKFVKKWQHKLGPEDQILTKSIISYGGIMKDDYMTKNHCNISHRDVVTIAWNGDMSPCNLDVNLAIKFGNLLESKVIDKNAWYESMLFAWRKEPTICSNCFDANNYTKNKWYKGSKKKVYHIKQSQNKTPQYSVVISIRNRYNKSLHNCLESLQKQTLPNTEIIIADHGSNLEYKKILRFLEPFDCNTYYFPTRSTWSSSIARNMGIRRALADHVLSLDADLILEPETLRLLYNCHKENPNSLIVNRLHYLPEGEQSKPGVGAVMSAPREWWHKVHGFDERMHGWGGPDSDLWKRAELDGMKRIIAKAKIYHQPHPPTKYKQRRGFYYFLYRVNRFIWRFDQSIIRNNENWGVWS